MVKLQKTAAVLIILILKFGFSSCQNKDTMKNYQWSPGIGAPKNYPVEVFKGEFYTQNDWVPVSNGAIVNAGWGTDNVKMTTGTIIPEGLKITYLSFVENKFYSGDFKLPSDTIQKLFEEGFKNIKTKEKVNYESIIIGLAPGGVVVVWMYSPGSKVEIGRYQANETQVNWKDFNPDGEQDRNVYINTVLEDHPEALKNKAEKGIQFGLWDNYRIKYTWKPVITLPKEYQLTENYMFMFNAEEELLFDETLEINKKRAIPREIIFKFKDVAGNKFGGHFYFDEEEIFQAFREIYKSNPELQAKLVFIPNESNDGFTVFVRDDKNEFELRKCRSKVYPIKSKKQVSE